MKIRSIRFKRAKRLPEFYKELVLKFHYERNNKLGGLPKHIKVLKES